SGPLWLKVSMPDIVSVTVNGMSTFGLFQPFAFGAGDGVPNVITGGVASRSTVTELFVVPAPDVALHVNVTPAVSCVTVPPSQALCESRLSAGILWMTHATFTSPVYHPCSPIV